MMILPVDASSTIGRTIRAEPGARHEVIRDHEPVPCAVVERACAGHVEDLPGDIIFHVGWSCDQH